MAEHKPDLESEVMCAIVLQDKGCTSTKIDDWSIEIPKERKPISNTNNYQSNKENVFKMVQITDIHYDPYYEFGSNANCDEPLCCQANSTASSPEDKAGYWSDYRKCDTPLHLMMNVFEEIGKRHVRIFVNCSFFLELLNYRPISTLCTLRETLYRIGYGTPAKRVI